MTLMLFAFFRLVVLLFSYVISAGAAALFLTLALFLDGDISWLRDDAGALVGSVGFATLMWFIILQVALLPFLFVVAVLEFSRLSSLLANLSGGGLCAAIIMGLLVENDGSEGLPYNDVDIWLAALAAGFVAGLAHWILAGHRAGRWLGRRVGPPPKPDFKV